MTAPVPEQAVTDALGVLDEPAWAFAGDKPDAITLAARRDLIKAALTAAAPAIREAERQRLAAEIPHGIIDIKGEITAGQVEELKAKWLAAWEAGRGKPLQVLPETTGPDRVAELEQLARDMLARLRPVFVIREPGDLIDRAETALQEGETP